MSKNQTNGFSNETKYWRPNISVWFTYLIIISFISISSSIGTSEEELKVHFKEKHKINTVKPFLIKRICRICDYDKSTSNDQLVKHITEEHPRSDYGDEDEGNIYFVMIHNII